MEISIQGDILLRRALVSDISALLELEKSVSGTKVYSPMLERGEWEEELRDSIVCLILKCGTVVGNLSYKRKGDDHVYISGLVVSPSFQGRGIARKVLVDLLKNLGNIQRIDLVTHPDNQKALQLYQSIGFVIESRKENFYGDGEPRLILVLGRK